MKKCLLSFFLIGFLTAFSQGIYYGYPYPNDQLQSGDIIFLNIPTNQDGRFLSEGGIEELITFFNKCSMYDFEIRIHFFYGSDEWQQSYSEFIAQCLRAELSSKCAAQNFVAFGCGDSSPIFMDENDKKYKAMNTLMEIIVK